jgi:hypothetical protein
VVFKSLRPRFGLWGSACATLAVVCGVASTASAKDFVRHAPPRLAGDFFLNSWAPSRAVGDARTYPLRFFTGKSYTIIVTGDFSAWGDWPGRHCGNPEPSPLYSSFGRPDTPVGDDAVFRFARPLYRRDCPSVVTYATNYFQINLGTGWKPFVPNGGIPSRPAGGEHLYAETVTGLGTAPQFRIVDWNPRDNSGELKITVTSSSKWAFRRHS